MGFLQGILALIAEWIVQKLWIGVKNCIVSAWTNFWANLKAKRALAANKKALDAAIASGDQHAITQAGADSLNNTSGS